MTESAESRRIRWLPVSAMKMLAALAIPHTPRGPLKVALTPSLKGVPPVPAMVVTTPVESDALYT